MIYCSNCGLANRDGSRFCNECGFRLGTMLPCPSCGLPNLSTSRFCNFCGQRLPFDQTTTPASQKEVAPVGAEAISDASAAEGEVPQFDESSAPARLEVEELEEAAALLGSIAAPVMPSSTEEVRREDFGQPDGIEGELGQAVAEVETVALLPTVETETGAEAASALAGVSDSEGIAAEQSVATELEAAGEFVEEGTPAESMAAVEIDNLPTWLDELSLEPATLEPEPASTEECAGAIVIARSLASPPSSVSADGSDADDSAAADLFVSVMGSEPQLVGLERFRRVAKRGWFGV